MFHSLLPVFSFLHLKNSWRQKTPIIQRRLDFWLVNDGLQDDIVSADIIPSIKSDHSAITMSINGVDDSERGPSFWKFNSSLVNDNNYRDLLDINIKSWLEEFKDVVDKRVLWDLLKYKIRQFTINYSKTKARDRRAKVNELEEKLQNCTEKCDKDPSIQNVKDLECLQAEYDQLYDYITQGAIVRSRATWYEKGEKNNKYFLNLEKSNKEKSCLRKVLKSDGTIAVNPKSIMSELESFYSNLYKESNRIMFTNEKLNLIGVVESPNCTFCQEATESVEHLLFSCRITSNFWKHVLSWLRDNDVHVGIINEPDVIFGKFDVAEDYILINHILLLGKYYIYSRKCQNSLPTFRGFIARTKRISNIELHIAREKNKLLFHFQKWEKLINVLNNC